MRVVIKPNKGFGKIKAEISKDLYSEILSISEKFGVSPEEIIILALKGNFKKPENVDLEKLEKEVQNLEKKVWELEKRYAPLKFKAYNLFEENKLLAIELSGLIAENVQLRRFLRKKVEVNKELRKIVNYYLGLGADDE
nr:hypothetical protein [Pyrococcus sp. ST04]